MADYELKRLLEGLLSDLPVESSPIEAIPEDAVASGVSADTLARLERHAMYLETASQVSHAASSILSLGELLPQMVDLIRRQFGFYYVGIFLVDRVRGVPGDWAVLQAGTGEAGRQMIERGHRLLVGGESMIGWCVAHRQARIALDVGKEAVRFDNPLLPHTRSEMALPLSSRGRILGAMTVQSAKSAAFSEEDISALQSMADQLANAIENARLFEDRERHIAELAIVNEIGQAVSSILDLDLLLDTVHQQVSRLFDTTNFYVATYEEATDEWLSLFHLEGGQRQPTARYSAEAGLTGYIIRTRQPVLLRSIDETLTFKDAHGVKIIGELAQSWLGVPLVTADKLVGVMAIQNYQQDHVYDDHDLTLFSTIAAQVANALGGLRLLEETRRQAREMETLHEVSLELAEEQQDLETVLQTITRRAMALLDSDGGEIWLWREKEEELELALSLHMGEVPSGGRRLKPGDGLPGCAFAERRIQVVGNDRDRDSRSSGSQDAAASSALAVPMTWQMQPLGVLVVTRSSDGRPYFADEQNLAGLLASQAAAIVQNARLFEETQQRLQELTMLARLSQTLAGATLQAEQIGQIMARQFVEVMGVPEASVSLLDPEQEGTLRTLADLYAEEGRIREDPEPETYALADFPATARAIEKGECLVVQASDPGADAAERTYMREHGVSTLAILPLTVKGQTIGIVELESWQSEHHYSPEELNLAMTLANQAAAALENARLFDEEQRARALLGARVNELDCLNDIGRKIDEAPPIGEFLDWVARRIPPAVQHPDLCRVAIEYEGRVYGAPDATELPVRMVQTLQADGGKVGRVVVAYVLERAFLDEERAFLGDIARRVSGYMENRRLLEQTQEALNETAMLYRVAQSLAQITDEREMFEFVLSEYLGMLDLAQGSVLIFDEDGRNSTLKALIVDGQPAEPGLRIPVAGNPAYEKLLATKDPVVINDAVHDPLLGPVRGLIKDLGYKSMLLVPILVGRKAAGALEADSTEALYEFTDRDVALVRAVADQLSIVMENRRLFRETQAALAEVEATHRGYLRRAWQDHLRQRELLQRSAFLYDQTRSGPDEAWVPAPDLWRPEMDLALRQGHGATGDGGDRDRAGLAIPITLRGQTIGVLGVEAPGQDRQWTREDLALVEAVGDQLAQTLETARLFADTRRRAERERLIGEITTKIRASTDMRGILETAATELGQVLGTSRALVRVGRADLDPHREGGSPGAAASTAGSGQPVDGREK
jgi:GAF domain-containing protein